MVKIRYPNLTARDEKERLRQLENYLRYLADQLNWALSKLEEKSDGNQSRAFSGNHP